jgi:hypothetical protein
MRIEGIEAALGLSNAVQEIHWYTQPSEKELKRLGMTLAQYSQAQAIASARWADRSGRLLTANLDLKSLVKLLKVHSQKLRILRMMRRSNWIELLRLLPKEMLVNALRLFSKAKLLKLILHLPKPFLIKMLLRIYKLEELIKKMPTAELLRIMRNKRVNSRELAKGILALEPKFILMLLQKIYGHHDYSKLKPYDIMRIFMHTPKERIMEAFKTMPFKALQQLVTGFIKKDPVLLMGMSDGFIFKLLAPCPKPILIDSCKVLPPEILIKLLSQLPDQFLMLAAAQVDDKTFEDFLISKHGDLLRKMAA